MHSMARNGLLRGDAPHRVCRVDVEAVESPPDTTFTEMSECRAAQSIEAVVGLLKGAFVECIAAWGTYQRELNMDDWTGWLKGSKGQTCVV